MKLPMARIQIVGLKAKLNPILIALQELGRVQIDDLPGDGGSFELDSQTVQRREDLTYLTTRLESLLAAFRDDTPGHIPPRIAAGAAADELDLSLVRQTIETVGAQLQNLANRQQQLEAEQASYPKYEATLRKLVPLIPQRAREPDTASLVVLVSQGHRWVLEKIVKRVTELAGDSASFVEENVGDLRAMLIVVPRELAPDLESVLGGEDISRLRLPDAFEGQSPDEAVASMSRRLQQIPAELAEINVSINALAAEHAGRLQSWQLLLEKELARIAILDHLEATTYTFIIRGWLPEKEIPAVADRLKKMDATLAITTSPLTEEEAQIAPVALVNPAPARPFESLVRIFSLPSYKGLDPTLLMSLFLPLFFGMILGDIGYGLVLLLICLAALRRWRERSTLRDLLLVLAISSGWAIVFGFLYGEAFGTLGEELGLHPLWLERAAPEQVTALLLFTVGVGAVHVVLGLILGTWEAWRARSRSHLLERGGMLVGLAGLFGLTAVLADQLPQTFMTPSIAVLILGIVLLSASTGWLGLLLGPIEFIGLIGNILSYLRIAAVGLASVYVALVANELAGSLGNIIVGGIVAVLIHTLNIALGAFSPTIHSLRLHYVEFFRKFYEGGGEPFRPFGSKSGI